jgi:hypothetical protein
MNVSTFLFKFSQSSNCLTHRKIRIVFFLVNGGSIYELENWHDLGRIHQAVHRVSLIWSEAKVNRIAWM